MNKNPFEIRSDILAMAKEYMDAQQAITTTLFQKAVEIGEKSIKDMPTLYTVDELTEKAKEMYNFVSKKD
jgi:hypothetical protein|tara:strand:- start:6175 stop:6384 length:210 start_codon:yes stop_codon:yes gene_type:complete